MNRKSFLKNAGILAAGIPLIAGKQSEIKIQPLLKPKALKRGDTVGLCAPAGIIYNDAEFEKMKYVLEEMGLRVIFGRHVKKRYGYLAGSDEQRAEDLNQFFSKTEIDAIVAVRGGWGSNRILPLLDYDMIRNNPKALCGFSDITSLHMALYRKSGLVSFHSPHGNSVWNDFSKNEFKRILFKEESIPVLRSVSSNISTITSGTSEGILFGGNMTVFTSLIGSEYLPSMHGAILFLEDIGEDAYKIDRMFSQLKMSGILSQISGFAFGQCTNCDFTGSNNFSLTYLLNHYIKPLNIPAVSGLSISHDPENLTIPVGVRAKLNATTGTIQLLEEALL
jgi:muramoyltetrapeptide carboxypeptidase